MKGLHTICCCFALVYIPAIVSGELETSPEPPFEKDVTPKEIKVLETREPSENDIVATTVIDADFDHIYEKNTLPGGQITVYRYQMHQV